MREVLEDLGLTDSEIKIYSVLLDLGNGAVGEISKKSGIHRRNVYDCLSRLSEKGFVSYIVENGVKVYSVTNPKGILERLELRKKSFENLLPSLIERYNVDIGKSETLFFSGKSGVKSVFEDQIQVGEEILVNGTSVDVAEVLKYFFPQFSLRRKERKLKMRMIFDKDFSLRKSEVKELKKLPLCDFRFVENFNTSPMSQYIYGNNVAIIVWSSNPIAILIRQQEVAQGFRESFEIMWKLGKKK